MSAVSGKERHATRAPNGRKMPDKKTVFNFLIVLPQSLSLAVELGVCVCDDDNGRWAHELPVAASKHKPATRKWTKDVCSDSATSAEASNHVSSLPLPLPLASSHVLRTHFHDFHRLRIESPVGMTMNSGDSISLNGPPLQNEKIRLK